MKRAPALLLLLLLAPGLPARDPDPKKWEKTIAAFDRQDEAKPFPPGGVVFTGSSSIALWRDLDKYFPDERVLNRGFGGSTLPDVNYYLDRAVLKHRPRVVVLYAGSNDMATYQRTPEEVLADFRTFCKRIHEALPKARVVYLSIHRPPGRLAQADKINEANRLIAADCAADPRRTFVNVHDLMLGKDGKPDPELYKDPLHPTPKAYQLWAEKLRPVLAK